MQQISTKELYVFIGILLFASVIRLYSLGVPSMWNDEIIVLTTADRPIDYIIDRALGGVDTHPPYYHIFVKWMMYLGRSDGALRMHSAVAGIISVALIFVFGRRFFSVKVGLISAAILSVNQLHILLSREVRPYSLIIMLSLAALYFIFRFLESRQYKWIVLAIVTDVIFSPLQFMSILTIGSQCCLVLISSLDRKSLVRFGDFLIFSFFALLTFIPNLLFIFHSQFSGAMSGRRLDVAINYASSVFRNIFPYENVVAIALVFVVILIAFCYSWKKGKNTINLLLLYVFVSILPLVVVKYNSYFNPWHVSFVMPAAVLVLAEGLASIFSGFRFFALSAIAVYLVIVASIFYSDKFYRVESHGGEYKQVAAELSGQDLGAIPLPTNFSIIAGADWYASNNGERLLDRFYTKINTSVPALSFIIFDDYAHYAKDAEEFDGKYRSMAVVASLPSSSIYTIPLNPVPDHIFDFPFQTTLSAEPVSFYSRISNVKNVTVYPYFKFRAIPYLDDVPSRFEYKILIDPRPEPVFYKVQFDCANKYPAEDEINISYAFNDKQFSPIVPSGDHGSSIKTILLKRNQADNELTIRSEMIRRSKKPGYADTDKTIVGINGVRVYANTLRNERFMSSTLDIFEAGISIPEKCPQSEYRWGYGPASTFQFTVPSNEIVTIEYEFNNPIMGQSVVFAHNGKILGSHENLAAQPWMSGAISGTITLNATAGENVISISYGLWNQHNPEETFAPQDGRKMTVAFTKLLINSSLSAKEEYVTVY